MQRNESCINNFGDGHCHTENRKMVTEEQDDQKLQRGVEHVAAEPWQSNAE